MVTIRSAEASAAGFTSGTGGFGRRFIRPDYRISARPSLDTPEILMLSYFTLRRQLGGSYLSLAKNKSLTSLTFLSGTFCMHLTERPEPALESAWLSSN